ncbi:MAG: hypothetical protein HeimC2_25030 [Candidatus Heimdallarchaeota archaeon LC_2]|nr:MAG: hypothetical protein HeimC2_25030 [Candidatus Heimdallarchaeota archaeon LC_2]
MVSISSPRVSSFIAIVLLTIYLLLVTSDENETFINPDVQLVFLLIVGTFIAIAAFNFAANEIKQTEGATSLFDISKKKLISIFLFASFITIGYNGLIVILLEIFSGTEATRFGKILTFVIVGFLLIFPFFQYIFLAKPGEGSSIPAEFPIEKMLESIRERVKSPFIAAVIAYFLSYVIPYIIIYNLVDRNFQLTIFLIAIILPLISLGALAGAGIGEDLIRLRLLRKPIRDLKKLGGPKINVRELKFEVGGFLLVIIAIQALVTTAIFGIFSIINALDINERATVGITGPLLFLTLFNKGRGSTKEMKEVWSEGGFKVDAFQIFLPIFVFFGVILSSALEVLVSQPSGSGVLSEAGLNEARILTVSILIIQNLVLISTALLIYRRPPEAAERRLIKEVPKFYGDDTTGYLYIYNKLTSDSSVENLLLEINKIINKDVSKAINFKSILMESFTTGSPQVQIAAAQVTVTITKRMKKFEVDYFELVNKAFNSEVIGSRIYAVRAMSNILKFLEGQQKEEAIIAFSEKINDPDSVVSWDTSLALQRLIIEEPEYRMFVLAYIIRIFLSTTHEGSKNAITRFLNRIAKESDEIGTMAISILGTQLEQGKTQHLDNLLQGIRALLRANSYLSEDLLDVISIGIVNPDEKIRKDYFMVLTNLAEYGAGRDKEVLNYIMSGVNDESTKIQILAYEALAKDVINHPELIDDIFVFLIDQFHVLADEAKIGALDVLEAIAKQDPSRHQELFNLLKMYADTTNPIVQADILKVMAIIPLATPSLSEKIYYIAEKNIKHQDEMVRVNAIHAVGVGVSSDSGLARAVHRRISEARNDLSLRVQLAAIEALGHVAAASRQLSDNIFEELKPLLNDDDWQVRLSTLNGLFVASKNRKDLNEQMVHITMIVLSDEDRTVRSEAVDILNYLLINHRPAAELFVNLIKKEIRKKGMSDEIRSTYYQALESIASTRKLLVSDILELLYSDFENDDSAVRTSINGAIKASVKKISTSKEQTPGIQKSLNKIMSQLLKAANNSYPPIRRDAYSNIAEICAKVPNYKVAKRGRNAIITAQRHEKDVGLLDFLETCRIKAKPPLSRL